MKCKTQFFFTLVLWLILPLAAAGSGLTPAKSMGERLRVGDDPQIGPTFTVNTTADSDDVCTISHCSLREAINAANAQAGTNSIIFAPAAYGTISPATALPTIIDDLVIGGPGVGYLILNGALVTHHSLLRVDNASLYLSGFTVWQGGSNMTPAGGALLATGTSQVSLNSMRFNENRAQFGGALALYNGATLNHVEFYGNQAMAGDGGAIVAFNDTVTMHNSSFNSNSASDRGGAVYMMGNFLNIYTSEFGNNTAVNGGAIYAEARPTIDRSRFLGNQATTDGGAFYTTGANFTTIHNSLLAENMAAANGNAVYIGGDVPALTHQLLHNTIAAPERLAGTAVYMAATGTLTLMNNIIANHTTGIAHNAGTLNEDYNLFHDNETDRDNQQIGPDSFNGNPQFVSAVHGLYELTPNSPAVDSGLPTAVSHDINDRPRPQGIAPDKGFYELAQTAVAGPGSYEIADTSVAITVTQAGDLAHVQLVWIPLDHPSYDEDDEDGDPTGQGGYWTIVGINSEGQTAAGFSLTLSLPHNNDPDPAVCRWHDDDTWDCRRHGYNTTTVWRHTVTAFSDWTVGTVEEEEEEAYTLYLPLTIRP